MKTFFNIPAHQRKRHKRNGFTLLEILTASAISLIIITALLGITQTILQNFQSIRAGAQMEGDAVVALDMMVNDLEALVVSPAPNSQSLMVSDDSSSLSGATGVWLTFVTAAIDTDPEFQGAARAVSYRLALQDPLGSGGDARYALYRAVATARDTFDNALGVEDQQADYWSGGGADTPNPTDVANYLVGDIVRFEIRFSYREAEDSTQPADPSTNPTVTKWTTSDQAVEIGADGVSVDGSIKPGGFQSVEIALTSLDAQGARILQVGGITLDNAIERFGRSYVRYPAIFTEVN
jgi:prepilin-type N-terminal cleavage/methylation domain-containing protein